MWNRGSGQLPCRLQGALESGVSSEDGVVVEEADESVLWLELLAETGVMPKPRLEGLLAEAHQLTAIFTASQRTAREHAA